MGEKVVNVRIRFPEDLHERVKGLARGDRRSLNAEVLALLEEAMAAREGAGQKSPPAYTYPEPNEHRATGRLMRAADPPAP